MGFESWKILLSQEAILVWKEEEVLMPLCCTTLHIWFYLYDTKWWLPTLGDERREGKLDATPGSPINFAHLGPRRLLKYFRGSEFLSTQAWPVIRINWKMRDSQGQPMNGFSILVSDWKWHIVQNSTGFGRILKDCFRDCSPVCI